MIRLGACSLVVLAGFSAARVEPQFFAVSLGVLGLATLRYLPRPSPRQLSPYPFAASNILSLEIYVHHAGVRLR